MRKKIAVACLGAVLLAAGCAWVFAADIDSVCAKLRISAQNKGLAKADAEQVEFALRNLAGQGVPAEQALQLMETAMEKNKNGKEISEIAGMLGETVKKSEYANEFSRMVRTCLEYNLKGEDINRVMAAVSASVGKDASPKQLRILCGDLLKEGCDGGCLEAACEATGKSVENGISPEESRKEISSAVMQCVRAGMKGEALAKEIRKMAQKSTGEKEKTMEKTRERDREGAGQEIKEKMSQEGGKSSSKK